MDYKKEITKLESEFTIKYYANIVTICLIIIFSVFGVHHLAIGWNILIYAYFFSTLYTNIKRIILIRRLIKEMKKLKIMDDAQKAQDYYKQMFDSFDNRYNDIFEEFRKKVTQPSPNQKIENAYKLMKVSKSDSIEKIKTTYKQFAFKWHPDKWATDTEENQKIAERNFKKLQSAYDLIKKDKNII